MDIRHGRKAPLRTALRLAACYLRTALSLQPRLRGAAALCLAALSLAGAGCLGPVHDDPAASAGCEQPNQANLIPEARMLPGRICQTCHVSGGEARSLPWTASGTVYPQPDSLCDVGGLGGVTVDILDPAGNTLISLTTNRSGNFFTSEDMDFSHIRARVSQGNLVKEMTSVQTSTACATCHQPGGVAGGRIYLN